MKTSLSLRHFLLALAVVAVWGSNFVVIKLALGQMPPLLFATLRFIVVVVPMVFFLPRPAVSWRNLAAYGLLIGVGQFGLLFVAMNGHISPGLASLVIQTQVFFTIGLAMWMAGESLQRVQWLALGLGAAGLAVIVSHTDGSTTLLGLGLILLTLWMEGWDAVATSLAQADAFTWAAVAWQAWGNSLFGYAAWGWLLARYSAATITPMALLVPLFGMGGSALWLNEGLPAWKLIAAALVLSGLALNLLWPWWMQRRKRVGAAS